VPALETVHKLCGGTHRRRATFDLCIVRGVVLRVVVCGVVLVVLRVVLVVVRVVLVVCVGVCDLFLSLQALQLGSTRPML